MQHAVERARHVRVRGDVVSNELEAIVAGEVRDVVVVPGHQVVEPDDRMPFRQEAIAQVGSQKAGRAGNQDSHAIFRPIESYVKPSDTIFSGSYRFRPSITI